MTPIELSAAALIGALLALLIYHFAAARPTLAALRRSVELHDGLISGGSSGAGERFAALERFARENGAALTELSGRVGRLEHLAQSDLSRVGFVRYDAFAPEGEPGFSYALALLNREGDGVVLTSIYSRNDTRTFGKSVSAFKPAVEASPEELKAIEQARLISSDGPAR
ncbi:MAG: DUF4446 family protein [Candidatus Eremiobacteraeota bacterium]|nr:DUF4446 family protein [Candidatus Eremiobacteraeota bacterium]